MLDRETGAFYDDDDGAPAIDECRFFKWQDEEEEGEDEKN